ncbi:MAG: hypothetical protein E7344_04915 [Clostridiales bacterium]|nr:hypothetical protein [Clostridiales bacterium]
MKIKNAIKIFFKNYNLVLKVAITQLVFIAVIFGIVALLASNVIVDVNTGLTEFGIIDKLSVIIGEISSGDFDAQRFQLLTTELQEAIFAWGTSVEFFYRMVAFSVLLILVLVLLTVYCTNFYMVPFNQNLHDFMSTSAKIPYFWRFVKSFGKSAKTQLVYIAFPLLLDLFIIVGTLGAYSMIFSYLGLSGVVLTIIILILLLSLRKTLFAFWIPAMVINQLPVVASMKEGFKLLADGFGKVFSRILSAMLLIAALITILLFAIVNVWTLLLVVFILLHGELLISTICMVEYYNQSNFGFYIDQMHTISAEGIETVTVLDEDDDF